MSDWQYLNKYRVRQGIYASDDDVGFNGAFCLVINGLQIKCIASDGEGWQHVSVSLHNSNFTPSWEVMSKVKELFWETEEWVIQFHPAQSEYVNFHKGCLHLWAPTEGSFPVPPSILVGPKL